MTDIVVDWSRYSNFSKEEFDCSHTDQNKMRIVFMDKIQALRDQCGFPIVVTSGYRHQSHPVEAKKARAGEHSFGLAADVQVANHRRWDLINNAMRLGFTRIGVSNSFIHLGLATMNEGFPSPRLWGY